MILSFSLISFSPASVMESPLFITEYRLLGKRLSVVSELLIQPNNKYMLNKMSNLIITIFVFDDQVHLLVGSSVLIIQCVLVKLDRRISTARLIGTKVIPLTLFVEGSENVVAARLKHKMNGNWLSFTIGTIFSWQS